MLKKLKTNVFVEWLNARQQREEGINAISHGIGGSVSTQQVADSSIVF
jgi:hypothetical protein